MAMQVAEFHAATRMAAVEQGREGFISTAQHSRVMVDPLWGEWAPADGKEPTLTMRLCFGFVPCAFVGCGAPGRRAWRQYCLSWSICIAVLQAAALFLALGLSGGFVPLSRNPMLGPRYEVFDVLGAKNVARILQLHDWWRLLTPILLHTGVLHLAGNLVVQLRTGVQLEVMWGHTSWLVVYVCSGAFATLSSCIAMPRSLSVGSSGALCGLIGAWLAFIVITWNQTLPNDTKERDQQVFSLVFSILIIVALSFLPLMDFAAHLGGLAAGAFIALALFANRIQHRCYRIATRAVGCALLTGLGVGELAWFLTRTPVDEQLLHFCRPPSC